MDPSQTHSWLCEQIVDNSHVAIVYADIHGIIRLWNAGAEDMFGYAAAEAIGQSMEMIIPEKHRARHNEGYHRVMRTGITKYGRDVLAVPALRKDGTRISIEFNISLMRSPDGQVLGAAAMIQDVTSRWEREKAMRAKVAALESKVVESQARSASAEAGES
jgi:PAS domain S-box-containing protein